MFASIAQPGSSDRPSVGDSAIEAVGLEFEAPAVAARKAKGRWVTMLRDLVVGIGALVVGVLGLILPVLPGWILIFVGLALIAGYVPPLRRALSRILRTGLATRSLASVANRQWMRKGFAKLLALRSVRNAIDSETRWKTIHGVLEARVQRDVDGAMGEEESS